ncbi:MAG: peptidoglycan DD-metalloendopeptidase family protein [Flavobacteriales bacterium]|nr:peptidoglycan DD-metalloendopeptidase family protein [Flavobacteriia bacterium]NCP06086.1 peptidoglycan DD-metalloendopeptidase family protein [Flavobacteriales bacterium]PIV94851.1 MAG: peptidase M23 [Flavobacteriaceae bacterium CG17_big_fil_post_rev_8_21_14_2_50_33_15]PIY10112.1 MAG: peptidase M23 [Flavobacteriaceae bacterium CG_4_10_14_3_um_filter_33_47]PJB18018.1 MAG: peptidase M23 [Flavobacteriaceae bacterium CG_4_9_14_3_um_filter_33_16]
MESFSNFLKEVSSESLYVLNKEIPLIKYVPINLSFKNTELEAVDVSSSIALGHFIYKAIKKQNGRIGFGGYNEKRTIYRRSNHFNSLDVESERNIHLGVDLWCEAESKVYTPLDGTVHSFKNNMNDGDYGPTIILKHLIDGITFYTLYGHLSLKSLYNLALGQKVFQGDCIATLGNSSVNGDYPPHLHFQIIKDMQDFKGDYPGVCSKKDLDFFLENCPDPNLLLKLKIFNTC